MSSAASSTLFIFLQVFGGIVYPLCLPSSRRYPRPSCHSALYVCSPFTVPRTIPLTRLTLDDSGPQNVTGPFNYPRFCTFQRLSSLACRPCWSVTTEWQNRKKEKSMLSSYFPHPHRSPSVQVMLCTTASRSKAKLVNLSRSTAP